MHVIIGNIMHYMCIFVPMCARAQECAGLLLALLSPPAGAPPPPPATLLLAVCDRPAPFSDFYV